MAKDQGIAFFFSRPTSILIKYTVHLYMFAHQEDESDISEPRQAV